MTSVADRIAGIHAAASSGTLDPRTAIDHLAAAAQERGGRDGRRLDGAYFTDHDVATWLATRAVAARLLDESGLPAARIDVLLAGGHDLVEELGRRCDGDAGTRAAVVTALGQLRLLDPTCGAGSFLVAGWEALRAVAHRLGTVDAAHPRQLHGVDRDPDAVAACRATLALVVGEDAAAAHVVVGDAERSGALPTADVLLGNPPFVRARPASAHVDLDTARVGNRSAWIVERALAAAAAGARVGFVLPVAVACADAYAPLRAVWARRCDHIHAAHFDTIPASLFDGVVQRITLAEGRVRTEAGSAGGARWHTSRYHRWRRDERDGLLDRVRHVRVAHPRPEHSLPKVGSSTEVGLLDVLSRHEPAGRWFATGATSRADGAPNRLHYKRRWSYFLLFTDFMPGIWDEHGVAREPSEFKSIDVDVRLDARALLAAYSSTLFWWYFSAFTDNRNVNRRDLAAFPFPALDAPAQGRLAALGSDLMAALRGCAEVRTCTYRSVGTIRNTYFRQAATRPVLDRIDAELARCYGMTTEQLEFVLDFERRFRGGKPSARPSGEAARR